MFMAIKYITPYKDKHNALPLQYLSNQCELLLHQMLHLGKAVAGNNGLCAWKLFYCGTIYHASKEHLIGFKDPVDQSYETWVWWVEDAAETIIAGVGLGLASTDSSDLAH